jgi:hypothetical protein
MKRNPIRIMAFGGFLALAVLNVSVTHGSKNQIVKVSFINGTQAAKGPYLAADLSSSGDSSLIFDSQFSSQVSCASSFWSRTDYYDQSGTLVGTFLIENGVVKMTYSGTYSTTISSSGGVAAHTATMVQCYSWGWGCTPITATQACQ